MQLYDSQGRRLYLTDDERKAFMTAARKASREVRSLCSVLHHTGCRISEALALTPHSVDLSGNVIVFESLKKRKRGVYRRPGPARTAGHARHGSRRPRNPEARRGPPE